jgi:FlaA1/EpsC-like NDP-sugar epimerase
MFKTILSEGADVATLTNIGHLYGKRILVTGAGGSIGSELCKRLVRCGIASLVMVDLSELNLYEAHRKLPDAHNCKCLIADVRHEHVMRSIFAKEKPQIVFHAAALKHVPILEEPHNMIEAIRTNVFGTVMVTSLAMETESVEQFVFVSTDKAVNPTSQMGKTKRCAELYVQYRNRLLQALEVKNKRLMTVRFGNVFGSSGSVVPLFREQIKKGGPITITHPDMVRFLMTVSSAVNLMTQVGSIPPDRDGYSTYIFDMGEPIRIVDLAKQLAFMEGYILGQDIKLEVIGMRPGEKLFEELYYKDEDVRGTIVPGILQGVSRLSDVAMKSIMASFDALSYAVDERDVSAVEDAMEKLLMIR